MEKQENYFSNDEIDKTQIMKETKTSQNMEKEPTYKTSKSFYLFPTLQRSTNNSFRTKIYINAKKKSPNKNQKNYEQNVLKKELSLFKLEMHQKKKELLKLKIKYSKLEDENYLNKHLISNVLGISLDKYLTKEEVSDKIENCKLSETAREKLQEAYEKILLKLEINEKKSIINEQNNYIEELKKNSKTKVINELEVDYFLKCEKQRKLLRNLKKLEDKYELYEKELNIINDYIEEIKKMKNELIKTDIESNNNNLKMTEERDYLLRQNKLLDDKIKRQIKINREKYNDNYENEKIIIEKEEALKEINDYKSERDNFLKILEKKKKTKEDSDKNRKDQENKISELNKEYDTLDRKMMNYNKERPKLIARAREPKSEIERKINLETELKKLNEEKENLIKTHEETQRKLKEEAEEVKKKNENNNKIIQDNTKMLNDLNQKKDELTKKMNEIDKKNMEIAENINKNKIEFDDLIKQEENLKQQNEQNELEYEENKKKADEEKKKLLNKKKLQYKRELDGLKNEQQNLKNDNKNLNDDNENYKSQINDFDKELEQYDEIEEKLKKAQSDLEKLKV